MVLVRWTAKLLSYVFHPLLMLTVMLVLLMLINPYLFGVGSLEGGMGLVVRVFLFTYFIPAFAVLLMALLEMIQSVEMHDKSERIGPFLITGILYLWLYINFRNNPEIPTVYNMLMLGVLIGLYLSFFLNLFNKISLHAVGMGGLLGMVVITASFFSYGGMTFHLSSTSVVQISMVTVISLVILLAGMVGSARLLLGHHLPKEVYGGYLVGFMSQIIAWRIYF